MERQILCGNGKALEVVTSEYGTSNSCFAQLYVSGFSPEDMAAKKIAKAKLLAGRENNLWTRNWGTTNWVVYSAGKDGDVLLTSPKFTPLLENVRVSHTGVNSGLNSETIELLMDNAYNDVGAALQTGVLRLRRKSLASDVPVSSFKNDPVTYFLFQEIAQAYGDTLGSIGIGTVPLKLVDEAYAKDEGKPFALPIWLLCLNLWSTISGSYALRYGDFGCVSAVREMPVRRD